MGQTYIPTSLLLTVALLYALLFANLKNRKLLSMSEQLNHERNKQKETTFTFSRLKQQKRQFSSNDQFDTLAGL